MITMRRLSGYCLIVVSGLLLQSCSSAPSKAPVAKEPTVEQQVTTVPSSLSAPELVIAAKQAWLETGDMQKRDQLLILAAKQYQASSCNKSLIVLEQLMAQNSPALSNEAMLVYAECMLLTQTPSEGLFDHLVQLVNRAMPPELQSRNSAVLAQIAKQRGQTSQAIQWLSNVQRNTSILISQPHRQIWKLLPELSAQDLHDLAAANPQLAAYQQLYELVRNTEIADYERQQALRAWLTDHQSHPLSENLPEGITQFMQNELSNIRNIAVLLPLSGRLQAQGDAIKQGILAAYFGDIAQTDSELVRSQQPLVQFIDTGSDPNVLSDAQINPTYLNQFDLVIGPLLKEQINQVEAFKLTHPSKLYLNRVSEDPEHSSNHGLYYSLAPEDEGRQLARLMLARGIKTPVLVSNGSGVSKRMQQAFETYWYAHPTSSSKPLLNVEFDDNKSMRVGITSALDVLQSQKRIRQIARLTSEKVHNVTRNRRDIDAFVVFARPNEVELINPIIESSISLFSDKVLPVYASSYSYQHQLSKNSLRDLRNLVFIDIPWLMPSMRSSKLAQQVDQIWNQPSSAFLRLFAFGYDSYQFIGKVQQQLAFKGIEIVGLSGALSVNDNNQVMRRLHVATIQDESIQELND